MNETPKTVTHRLDVSNGNRTTAIVSTIAIAAVTLIAVGALSVAKALVEQDHHCEPYYY